MPWKKRFNAYCVSWKTWHICIRLHMRHIWRVVLKNFLNGIRSLVRLKKSWMSLDIKFK